MGDIGSYPTWVPSGLVVVVFGYTGSVGSRPLSYPLIYLTDSGLTYAGKIGTWRKILAPASRPILSACYAHDTEATHADVVKSHLC